MPTPASPNAVFAPGVDPVQTAESLADDSLVDAIRIHAQWQRPSECVERDGVLMLAGCDAVPIAYKNCAARTTARAPAAAALAQAARFFAERGRDHLWFVRTSRDADLEAELQAQDGAKLRSDSPCMLVTERLAVPPLPAGLRAAPMTQPQQVHDAATVLVASYALLGLPASEVHSLFGQPERVLASPCTGVVIYRKDEPVAVALTLHSRGASGIYWVGTAPSAQRLGLATLCTALATNAGFDAGAKVVTLQASPLGEPVYTRMGYRVYDRLRWYGVKRR